MNQDTTPAPETEGADSYTTEQLSKMLAGAENQASRAFAKKIEDYLTTTDIGMGGLAKLSGVPRDVIKKGFRGRHTFTNDEQTRLLDAIQKDSRAPSRKQRAFKRKARIALSRAPKANPPAPMATETFDDGVPA